MVAKKAGVLGPSLAHFDRLELLGRGGAGTVYRARDRTLQRYVAVKVLHDHVTDPRDPTSAEQSVPPEAVAHAAMSWHSNVLTLYGSGVAPDGAQYLVLEFAPGGSLSDRVSRRGPLPRAEWLQLGIEVGAALEAAHRQGLVHCDIKPSNILLAADGSTRLADFGLARASNATSRTLDDVAATVAFAPPEMLEGDPPRAANARGELSFDIGLFARSTIERLVDRFLQIVTALVERPDARLSQLVDVDSAS